MKIRRELFADCLSASAPRFSQRRASVAHHRANYFFPAQGGGWGSERGRAPDVIAVTPTFRRKNGILILVGG